jgi:hypothetical protein
MSSHEKKQETKLKTSAAATTSPSPRIAADVERKETASRMSICKRIALFSTCWMIIAFCLKLFLEPSLEGKIYDIFVQVLLCVLILFTFDVIICCKSLARWFILHALGNFIVVYFSINDTVRCPTLMFLLLFICRLDSGGFRVHHVTHFPAFYRYESS